ncbi:MAG: sensor histidine kinase [Alistipes sp.]|nr:sensor histidine kinase [Alistipes sp.]
MFIQILILIAILVQTVATVYALKLVRATKYNSIWILFIIGFSALSVERVIQLLVFAGHPIPRLFMADVGFVVSICLSIGVMYAHKLFKYIDRLNYQRQLWSRRMLSGTLRAEEMARSNFSKELHDGLGPLLSSAKMSLSALQREEKDPARSEMLANTTYLINEAIRSIREISNNLSPHVLQDFGLARGVQNFIDKSASMHNVKILFTTNLGAERFESDVEVIFYRVICELINNSLKHAACDTITLKLTASPTELSLDYRDNGRGFNPELMADSGMGLSNISSRIGSLGGSCSILSKPGAGMQALIHITRPGAEGIAKPTPKHRKKRK